MGKVLVVALSLLLQQQARTGPRTGRFTEDVKDPKKGDVMMHVAMSVPDKLPPQKTMGLIFLFHGFNGNEGNYIGGTVDVLKRNKLTDEYVVISGKSKGAGWTEADDEPVLRMIEWAKQTYPIDPRRVYIWGSSNGAAYVGRFGWEQQSLVAGVIAYCGGGFNFSKGAKAENPADTKTEWYFVHGGADNPQNSRKGCEQLAAKAYRYIFRQLDGYGHTDIWDGNGHPDKTVVDAVRDDWLAWIHALRHKEIAPNASEEKILTGLEKPSMQGMLQNPGTYIELMRIGGPQAGKVILAALQSKNAAIRGAAAQASEKTMFDTAVTAEIANLLSDTSEKTVQQALKTLGALAVWRFKSAQEALVQYATTPAASKGTKIPERLLAIEGIGKALKLAFLGNFEDKALWWALVHLLDDEDQRIRAASITILSKAVADGFGYKPENTGPARSGPIAKWADWCTKKCGPEKVAEADAAPKK